MFAISYHPDAAEELRAIRAFDRVRILEDVAKHLSASPATVGGRKKKLDLGGESFICQLRVGTYRVFYDVDEAGNAVIVRHVRRKDRKITGEIL